MKLSLPKSNGLAQSLGTVVSEDFGVRATETGVDATESPAAAAVVDELTDDTGAELLVVTSRR